MSFTHSLSHGKEVFCSMRLLPDHPKKWCNTANGVLHTVSPIPFPNNFHDWDLLRKRKPSIGNNAIDIENIHLK